MIIRIVANAVKLGGGERSAITIVRMLMARGHEVVWHPTTPDPVAIPVPCEIGLWIGELPSAPADLLIYLTNNSVAPRPKGLHSPLPPADRATWERITREARRRVMIVNWQIGLAGRIADLFDHAAFLSSALRAQWLRLTGWNPARTWMHAPAVELEPLLALDPDYGRRLIVRHSAPAKWPPDTPAFFHRLHRAAPRWRFHLMGCPYPIPVPRVRRRPVNSMPVPAFLMGASLYVYPLRHGYTDQGPRTIVEAMAAGLPCMVDDRDGPADRVTPQTGWLFSHHSEYARILRNLTPRECEEKGEAARERAIQEFDPEDWANWLEEAAT